MPDMQRAAHPDGRGEAPSRSATHGPSGQPFVYRKPGPKRAAIHADCGAQFQQLYEWILANVPESRERSLALTNLEQAAMWSNKAIAFHVTEAAQP